VTIYVRLEGLTHDTEEIEGGTFNKAMTPLKMQSILDSQCRTQADNISLMVGRL